MANERKGKKVMGWPREENQVPETFESVPDTKLERLYSAFYDWK